MNREEKKNIKRKISGHGSVSKAGKVRQTTPKIPITNKNKSLFPRVNKRRLYHNRIMLKRDIGQYYAKD